MCTNLNGTNAPFCEPASDATFALGETVKGELI
jgi:hypothetical protein